MSLKAYDIIHHQSGYYLSQGSFYKSLSNCLCIFKITFRKIGYSTKILMLSLKNEFL